MKQLQATVVFLDEHIFKSASSIDLFKLQRSLAVTTKGSTCVALLSDLATMETMNNASADLQKLLKNFNESIGQV
jgi:hypothetical protein